MKHGTIWEDSACGCHGFMAYVAIPAHAVAVLLSDEKGVDGWDVDHWISNASHLAILDFCVEGDEEHVAVTLLRRLADEFGPSVQRGVVAEQQSLNIGHVVDKVRGDGDERAARR